MILGVYSIQDRQSGYSSPTFEMNDAVAIRNFENAVLSTAGVLKTHAQDFTLCSLGTFDTQSGLLQMYERILPLIAGNDVLIPKKE